MTDDRRSESNRLVGWKEISAYLNKGVRTVQRWERELGLPVRRVKTSTTGQSVYAERDAIEEWLQRQSRRELNVEEAAVAGVAPSADVLATSASPVPQAPAVNLHWVGLIAGVVAIAVVLTAWTRPRAIAPNRGSAISLASTAGADFLYAAADSGVIVVDTVTNRVVRTIEIPKDAGYGAFDVLAASADGRRLVIPTGQPPGVVLFDIDTETFGRWYASAGRHVTRARFSPDGTSLFVVERHGHLYMLDARSGDPIADVAVPGESFDGSFDRDGRRFLMPNRDAGTISVVDISSSSVVAAIETPGGAHDLITTSDRSRGFVTNEYDGSVSCVDLDSAQVTTRVPVGTRPIQGAMSSSGATIYVANRDSNSLSILDGWTCKAQTTLQNVVPGARPGAVALAADDSRLYVASLESGTVAVYDTTRTPLALLGLVDMPSTIGGMHAVSPVRLSAQSWPPTIVGFRPVRYNQGAVQAAARR